MGLSSQEGRLNPIESKVAPEKNGNRNSIVNQCLGRAVHPIEYKLNPI